MSLVLWILGYTVLSYLFVIIFYTFEIQTWHDGDVDNSELRDSYYASWAVAVAFPLWLGIMPIYAFFDRFGSKVSLSEKNFKKVHHWCWGMARKIKDKREKKLQRKAAKDDLVV